MIFLRILTFSRLNIFAIIDKNGSICTFLYDLVQKITIWIGKTSSRMFNSRFHQTKGCLFPMVTLSEFRLRQTESAECQKSQNSRNFITSMLVMETVAVDDKFEMLVTDLSH